MAPKGDTTSAQLAKILETQEELLEIVNEIRKRLQQLEKRNVIKTVAAEKDEEYEEEEDAEEEELEEEEDVEEEEEDEEIKHIVKSIAKRREVKVQKKENVHEEDEEAVEEEDDDDVDDEPEVKPVKSTVKGRKIFRLKFSKDKTDATTTEDNEGDTVDKTSKVLSISLSSSGGANKEINAEIEIDKSLIDDATKAVDQKVDAEVSKVTKKGKSIMKSTSNMFKQLTGISAPKKGDGEGKENNNDDDDK